MTKLNNENFDEFIKNNDKLVIVDFWAEWCKPCVQLGAVLEEINEEMSDKVEIAKVNVDENQDLSTKFNIGSIPSLHFYKNGTKINEAVGFLPKEALISFINKNL